MKPVYIYVENYKCLNNFSVLLNSEYCLDQDILEYKKSSSLVYDHVESISCFVGENGVGKSTILELIIKILLNEDINSDYQFIFESRGSLYSSGIKKIKSNKIQHLKSINRLNFPDISICYYSPIYNPHQAQNIKKRKLVKDVSSDNVYRYSRGKNSELDLAYQFKFLNEMNSFAEKKLSFDKYFDISFKEFNFQTIKRRLLEILSDLSRSSENKQISLLKEIEAYVPQNSLMDIITEYVREGTNKSFERLNDELNIHFRKIQDKYIQEIYNYPLFLQIKLTLFLDYFHEVTSPRLTNIKKQTNVNRLSIFSALILTMDESVGNWADEIMTFMSDTSDDFDIKKINDRFLKCKKIFKNYEKSRMPLNFHASESEEVIQVISDLRKNNLQSGVFFYRWRGVSSGQLAKLNFYSRIYSCFENYNSDELLLILDEADIYLHPDWQTQFFSDLFVYLKELKKVFENLKSINLIMTTHSPLMLTDLYSNSVFQVSLKNGIRKIVQKNELTFASNIYDLYENEFSLENTKGNFAMKKIEELVRKIRSKNVTVKDLEILESIGEPVIKISIENLMRNL